MGQTENVEKAPKTSWFDGVKAEFKKIIWPEQKSVVRQTIAVIVTSVVVGLIIALLDKTIENRHLEDQILEVRVPLEEVTEVKNGVKKQVSKKMFPGYVLIHMIMNDDTWYVVRNTRGVTGFVGPGSKPVPLTDAEMRPLGIKAENVVVDFAEGDMIVVIGGVWKDTCGVITAMNHNKQTVTINVDLFGRETPVEVSFADVKKMN